MQLYLSNGKTTKIPVSYPCRPSMVPEVKKISQEHNNSPPIFIKTTRKNMSTSQFKFDNTDKIIQLKNSWSPFRIEGTNERRLGVICTASGF